MTNETSPREVLQRILQDSQVREKEIRRRMEWIETHRRELWKRLDRVQAETDRGASSTSVPATP